MSCHAVFHAIRTVEMRSPGGSDGPHMSLVTVLRSAVAEVGEDGGRWSRDILGLTWHNRRWVLAFDWALGSISC